ncbi:hypothetical protein E4U37_005525 [Claviceps purpurea]|nr:hypothetical protein E4U37_005525 [Claviceps purpurea]
MAAAGITGSGGSKNARYTRHKGTRGMIDIPEGKNDDQASVNPRAKTGHHDLVKSRPRSRGGGNGCDVDVATPAIGATSTETENQSETTTATGSATVTASVTTGDPVTDFSGQGFADGKIAVRNAPCHPASTSLKRDSVLSLINKSLSRTKIAQPLDGYTSTLNVNLTPGTTSLATASASSPSAASTGGNRIAPAVAITIGLATIAGIALIFATLLYCKVCRRLPRSGRLGSLHLQDEPEANRSLKPPLRVPSPSPNHVKQPRSKLAGAHLVDNECTSATANCRTWGPDVPYIRATIYHTRLPWFHVTPEDTCRNQHFWADNGSEKTRTAPKSTSAIAASKQPPHQLPVPACKATCK